MSNKLNKIDRLDVKSKIILSTSSQILGQIITAILAILTLKIIANSLGLRSYGIYATALAFVSTFSLITDLGINAIAGREIAKNPEKADEIIGYNMGLRLCLSLIGIPVIIGIGFIFYHTHTLRLSIIILSTYLLFDAIRSVLMAYFTAKVRNDLAAFIGVIQQALMLCLSILSSLFLHSVYGFLFAFVISNGLSAMATVLISSNKVSVMPRINIRYWRKSIRLSLSLGIILIINLLYLKIDSILLSIFKGSTDVGVYNIAYSLVLTFLTLPGFIMTALIPSLATTKQKEDFNSLVEKAYAYMIIFACLLVVGGYIVRTDIVQVVSNSNFTTASTPFAILCLASGFSYLNNVFGFASVAINKHQRLVFVSLGTLILNVLLNLIFIPHFSVDGAAWATVVSEFLAFIFVYVIFSKKTNTRINLVRHTYKPLLAAALTLVSTTKLAFIWKTSSSLLNTLVSSLIFISIYFVVLYTLKGIPTEAQDFFKKIWPRKQI